MTLDALIKPLNQLLTQGACPVKEAELNGLMIGLAHPTIDNSYWTISQRLLTAHTQLLNDCETIAAILATNETIKQSWCQIMAERCKEAGQLTDANVLVHLISQLGEASAWVELLCPQASLAMTPFASLERTVLGTTAEQNQATLILARVLRTAYQLRQWQKQPLEKLSAVLSDGSRPDINWCSGRTITQPGSSVGNNAWLLTNSSKTKTNPDFVEQDNFFKSLDWVLKNPWCYLLALIVYEQNVLQVEGSGGLLLELPEGQSPYQPTEIQVLVLSLEDDEISCGSLGSYTLRILNSLNMSLYPAGLTQQDLNIALSPIIGALLDHKVWQYREGASGEQGQYQIHPGFSDVCYGRKGQPVFSRFAKNLRYAIRSQASQWHDEIKSTKTAKINEKSLELSPRIKANHE
ncbi:TPA: hypothetical protein F7146_10440 [Legionella pneumophila]|nr:hypothetical protein [Legionella pneumophila]